MKKLFFAIMAMTALVAVSCDKTEKEDDKTIVQTGEDTTAQTGEDTPTQTSIVGRWDAARYAETPEDIAFVAIFGEEDLDLYVIAWGQHMKGTYTWENDVVTFNITEAKKALTNVTYDEEGNMDSWDGIMPGDLDATTLTLAEGYDWYPMNDQDMALARDDFGQFDFKVSGNTATSALVGIENITFNKVN